MTPKLTVHFCYLQKKRFAVGNVDFFAPPPRQAIFAGGLLRTLQQRIKLLRDRSYRKV